MKVREVNLILKERQEKHGLAEFVKKERNMSFTDDLKVLINKHGRESGSGTPDYILAIYICKCLEAYEGAVRMNKRFHNTYKRSVTHGKRNDPVPEMRNGDTSV